ncbi:MAG TPA: glycosyltransferase family 25 protein [Bryobacteraceae bacterium]|nr:glycosyltransferase family 25 protein [Bryobacteraceae bacterium]
MKKIIEYFDHAYVINLQDRHDRRRQAESEFQRIGIDLPGKKVDFFTAVRPTDSGNFQNVGVRGCFNSHRSVLQLADQKNLRNVLVFEDDVCFRDVGALFENRLLAKLDHEDWDLIFFGYLKPDDQALTGPLVLWPEDILGAHFYAVNGRFIRTMIRYMNDCEQRPRDHPQGGPMVPDGAYNHIRYLDPDIKLLLSVPSLAHQRNSRTDVAPRRFFDEIVWLRQMIIGMRSIKSRIRMVADRRKLRRQLDQ